MTQFKVFATGVEINGETILSVVNSMGSLKAMGLRILAENGIKEPESGEWYSQQAWLNAFKAISDQMGVDTLLSIGKSIPESVNWPPEVDTLEKALASIDVAYHMNHRNGKIGYYRYQSIGANSGKMKCNNPYPSEFDRGIILAVIQKFAPQGSSPVVKLDLNAPTRRDGGESCTFLIFW